MNDAVYKSAERRKKCAFSTEKCHCWEKKKSAIVEQNERWALLSNGHSVQQQRGVIRLEAF